MHPVRIVFNMAAPHCPLKCCCSSAYPDQLQDNQHLFMLKQKPGISKFFFSLGYMTDMKSYVPFRGLETQIMQLVLEVCIGQTITDVFRLI